jgi:hypothetical protein
MNGLKGTSASQKLRRLTLQASVDLLERMEVSQSLDLGSALIYIGRHPDLGKIGLFSSAHGQAALLECE